MPSAVSVAQVAPAMPTLILSSTATSHLNTGNAVAHASERYEYVSATQCAGPPAYSPWGGFDFLSLIVI